MHYLIFNAKGRELGRRPLQSAVDIGRSPECDVCIHDILLSRRHCRIEADGQGWRVLDLSSKNGTRVDGKGIDRHPLSDGQIVQIGKSSVVFHAGAFAPVGGEKTCPAGKTRRPADPWEAMSATVSGFEYIQAHTQKVRIGDKKPAARNAPVGALCRFPTPQPNPLDPDCYRSEDIYSMLTEITSSSWDSIYLNASRPLPRRTAPSPMVRSGRHPRRRGASPVAESLAADAGLLATPSAPRKSRRRWKRALVSMARGFAAVGQMVMVLGIGRLFAK